MKRALFFLLLALSAASLLGQTRVVLSIGHSGAVQDAASHPTARIAFTVGDDGRLLVWDLELNALLHRYQISHNPIVRVVPHPARDEVALVIAEGVDRASIRVINWKSGEEVFRREVTGVPVYFGYSPTGAYLVYSLPTFQSLFFLSSERGSPRSYLDDGFGIVSFVQMGSTERNAMTYVPARGEFIYWNLQSGDEIQRVRTQPRLDKLTLVDPVNRRALAAAADNELVIVDNIDGEIRASYPVTPIHDIRYDAVNSRILVLTDQLGQRAVLSFTYENGRLRRDIFRPSGLSPTARFLIPMTDLADALISGDSGGVVDLFADLSGRKTVLGPTPTVPIRDVAFTEGRLHLSLGDHILTLVSDAFQSTATTMRVSSIRQSITVLPDTTNARIESADNRLLIWGSNSEAGTIWSLNPPNTVVDRFYLDERKSPVLDVRYTDGGPIITHRDGRIVQLSADTATERYRYEAPGARTAIWDSEMGLLAAKTKSNNFDSSLIRIDQQTGETVRLPSEAFLTTDLTLGGHSTLYAIGLYGSPASATTRLVRYSGDRFSQNTIISEFAGEDPRARAVWDEQTNSLFTTLGFDGLQRVAGRSANRLDSMGQIPREVVLGGLYVATVNTDGSITLWNKRSGEFLLDVYVFSDDDWIAMNSRGAFLASDRAIERYLDFIPQQRTRLDINDFRIALPYRE